jgi:2-hydroxychromene-2-carboxylate isomerase
MITNARAARVYRSRLEGLDPRIDRGDVAFSTSDVDMVAALEAAFPTGVWKDDEHGSPYFIVPGLCFYGEARFGTNWTGNNNGKS